MTWPVSSLWHESPPDLEDRLKRCLDAAGDRAGRHNDRYIFFRADDVGVPGKNFARLMEPFTRLETPLSLAVVPAWLTEPRWRRLKETGRRSGRLWCWHQHGWRHKDHQTASKKGEFGPGRSRTQIENDLKRGRDRLHGLLGEDFSAVFTPPWNRCDGITLELLKELGYHAISRGTGCQPPAPDGLPEFEIQVDLHTRKEPNPEACWEALLKELETALSGRVCGLMIHHQRMNEAAFGFLGILLSAFSRDKNLCLVNFKDLIKIHRTDSQL